MSNMVNSWEINSHYEYIKMIASFKKTRKTRLKNKIASKSRSVNRNKK